MASNLKVLLMTNRSEYLIGQVTELDEEPAILVEKCFSISPEGVLSPFPAFASQRDLFLTSDSVLTIVDASEEITKEYNAQNE
tara:strand:- start:418 stop:666 length:249 start_codon:yes stop_codon:yes gene_type:complete